MIWLAITSLYFVMSLVTFIAYAIDKRRAMRGKWRIPESRLHLLELACGWPGALAAQILFHHKRRKLSYMLVFSLIVALHIGGALICWRAHWLP